MASPGTVTKCLVLLPTDPRERHTWTEATEGMMNGMGWACAAHGLSYQPQPIQLQPTPLLGPAPLGEAQPLTRARRAPSLHPP